MIWHSIFDYLCIMYFAIFPLILYSIYQNAQQRALTKKIMATLADFQAIITRIETAAADIAQDLTDLKAKIEGQGLSADLEAEVLALLDAKATQLEAIAAENPETPVEEEEETPEEPEA